MARRYFLKVTASDQPEESELTESHGQQSAGRIFAASKREVRPSLDGARRVFRRFQPQGSSLHPRGGPQDVG
jgi:hypothetical protein